MLRLKARAGDHIHYAVYSAIILAVVLKHGDRPVESAGSKLTLVLMALLMLAEGCARAICSCGGPDDPEEQ